MRESTRAVRQRGLITMIETARFYGPRNNLDQYTPTHTERGYFGALSIDLSPFDIWPSCATLATHPLPSLSDVDRLLRAAPLGYPALQSFSLLPFILTTTRWLIYAAKSTSDFLSSYQSVRFIETLPLSVNQTATFTA